MKNNYNNPINGYNIYQFFPHLIDNLANSQGSEAPIIRCIHHLVFFHKEPKLLHARGRLGKGNHWNRQGMWGRDTKIQEPSLVTRGTTKAFYENLCPNLDMTIDLKWACTTIQSRRTNQASLHMDKGTKIFVRPPM